MALGFQIKKIEGVKNELSTATEEIRSLQKGIHEVTIKSIENAEQHEKIADPKFRKFVITLEDNTGAQTKEDILLPEDTTVKKHAKLGMRANISSNLILSALGFTPSSAEAVLEAWNWLMSPSAKDPQVENIVGGRYSVVLDYNGVHAEYIKGNGNEKAKYIMCNQDGTQVEDTPEFANRDELKLYAKERSIALDDFLKVTKRYPPTPPNNWDCELPQTPV